MIVECFLVVQGKTARYGRSLARGTVRVTTKKPSTKQDEIAINLCVEIPDALFTKPTLQATIIIPPGQTRESVISAQVADNIAEAIAQQTGLRVAVSAVEDQ